MIFSKVFIDMYKLPRGGIFIFLNYKKRTVYISFSKNLVWSLAKNVKEIQDRVHVCNALNTDIRDLEFMIIETLNYHDTLLDIHSKMNDYIQYYRNKDYVIKHSRILQPRFVTQIGEDLKVYCKLKGQGIKEYIVGVFNNLEESKEFQEIYRNMKIIYPVYAINDLTREYCISSEA